MAEVTATAVEATPAVPEPPKPFTQFVSGFNGEDGKVIQVNHDQLSLTVKAVLFALVDKDGKTVVESKDQAALEKVANSLNKLVS